MSIDVNKNSINIDKNKKPLIILDNGMPLFSYDFESKENINDENNKLMMFNMALQGIFDLLKSEKIGIDLKSIFVIKNISSTKLKIERLIEIKDIQIDNTNLLIYTYSKYKLNLNEKIIKEIPKKITLTCATDELEYLKEKNESNFFGKKEENKEVEISSI